MLSVLKIEAGAHLGGLSGYSLFRPPDPLFTLFHPHISWAPLPFGFWLANREPQQEKKEIQRLPQAGYVPQPNVTALPQSEPLSSSFQVLITDPSPHPFGPRGSISLAATSPGLLHCLVILLYPHIFKPENTQYFLNSPL